MQGEREREHMRRDKKKASIVMVPWQSSAYHVFIKQEIGGVFIFLFIGIFTEI